MKVLSILSILLLGANQAFSYTESKLLCLESGQTAYAIVGQYYQASNDSEQSYVTLTKHQTDGIVEVETLKGEEPDFSVMTAHTDNENEKIVIISSFEVKEGVAPRVRVLMCTDL